MMRGMTGAMLALALSACAAVPKDIALDASSGQGLIVIEADALRSGATLPQFSLSIARFSPEAHRLASTPFGGWAGVNSAAAKDGRVWLVGRADPGAYVITALTHQATWHACFNGGTRAFTVEPGKVVFLGRIDPAPALFALATELPSYSMNGQNHFAMDKSLPFVPAAEIADWEAPVAGYLKAAYPNVVAPVTAVASTATTFNTGRDAFGLQRVCGGYYAPRGKAEEASPPG